MLCGTVSAEGGTEPRCPTATMGREELVGVDLGCMGAAQGCCLKDFPSPNPSGPFGTELGGNSICMHMTQLTVRRRLRVPCFLF